MAISAAVWREQEDMHGPLLRVVPRTDRHPAFNPECGDRFAGYSLRRRIRYDFGKEQIRELRGFSNALWDDHNFLADGLPGNPDFEHRIQGLYIHRMPDLSEDSIFRCSLEVAARGATYLTHSEFVSCLIDGLWPRIGDERCVALPYPDPLNRGSHSMSYFFRNPKYAVYLDRFSPQPGKKTQEYVVLSCQGRIAEGVKIR